MNNYERLLSGDEIPYLQQMGNSVIIAVSQSALTLLFASMVGWGFAKYEFRGKTFLTIFLLFTFAIPFQVTLVPLFQMIVRLGLLDSFLGVILPSSVSAFGAFFMRQAMVSIPQELLDAGRIDGASEWGLFWRIGIPLSRGALSILCVLVFLTAWNDYLWPLIVLRTPEKFTYPSRAGDAGWLVQGRIRHDPGRRLHRHAADRADLRRGPQSRPILDKGRGANDHRRGWFKQ